jgi:tRNA-specific 2-thiouridylase
MLGIPYYSINFAAEYMERVFSLFISEYSAGRTPNPDVLCNREIKFGPFLDHAFKLGADRIATGHYAGVEEKDGKFYLIRAADESKDQTYFLHQLNQRQLSSVIFPLAGLKKGEVREIAKRHGLPVAEKKDSTGICFIGERKFREFLKGFIPAQRGKIMTADGTVVGEHNGVMYYTIGQGSGLNIGGVKGFEQKKWFIVDKDVKNNILLVAQGGDASLYKDALTAKELNWIPAPPESDTVDCAVKIRYRQPDQRARLTVLYGEAVDCRFEEPQRAISPGQYAVFYDGKYCLGGGKIV